MKPIEKLRTQHVILPLLMATDFLFIKSINTLLILLKKGDSLI